MSVTDSVSNKTLNQVLANSSQAKATDTSLAAASKAVAGNSKALGKDAFMQLLVTQLKNQNPLDPQDNTAFVAQLA